MLHKPVTAVVTLLLAIVLLPGCQEVGPVDPIADSSLSEASLAKYAAPADFATGVKNGIFTVCKVADPASREFTFTTTAVTNPNPGVIISPVDLGNLECEDVFTAPAQYFDNPVVTITEDLPAGWTIDKVEVWSIDAAGTVTKEPDYPAGTTSITGTIVAQKDGCLAVFHNSGPRDFRGCTPGFWKNNWDKKGGTAWPAGIDGDLTTLADVGFSGFSNDVCDGDATSFFDALSCGGNAEGQAALMRHAAAAYLNASHPLGSFNVSPADLVTAVNDALAAGAAASTAYKDQLDTWNNQGCFVDQQGNFKPVENDD